MSFELPTSRNVFWFRRHTGHVCRNHLTLAIRSVPGAANEGGALDTSTRWGALEKLLIFWRVEFAPGRVVRNTALTAQAQAQRFVT